jgi:hypothetical protein
VSVTKGENADVKGKIEKINSKFESDSIKQFREEGHVSYKKQRIAQ